MLPDPSCSNMQTLIELSAEKGNFYEAAPLALMCPVLPSVDIQKPRGCFCLLWAPHAIREEVEMHLGGAA